MIMTKKNRKQMEYIAFGGIWAMLFVVIATPVFISNGITPESLVLVLTIFTPIQFVIGITFFALVTWIKDGRLGHALWQMKLKRMARQGKDIACQDGGIDECTKIAEWALYPSSWWQKEYPNQTPEYYCTQCMIANLEGVHTGGGPTAESYNKIIRIKISAFEKGLIESGKKKGADE